MFVTIRKLLSEQQLHAVDQSLASADFRSGKSTAGASAQSIKENLQAEAGPGAETAGRIIVGALQSSQPFQLCARPKHILSPIFSRYETGMSYGKHLDNPLMGHATPVRTDVSVTVFLGDADSYGGGELVIESDLGPTQFKGDSGDAVVYPSTSLHRVEEVTSGVRKVAVTWAQSMIRSAEQRKLLFDLAILERSLKEKKQEEARLAEKCHFNLFRMWSDV